MRKITVLLMGVLLSLAMANYAHANLLLNPGFESGQVDWTFGTSSGAFGAHVHTGDSSRAHSGTNYGEVDINMGGFFYQQFLLPGSVDAIEYGAYLNIFTNSVVGNWDQVQIYIQVVGFNDEMLGGSVGHFNPGLFTPYAGGLQTGYFLLSGTLDVSGIATDQIAAININLQNYDRELTGFRVDDAFVEAVPEPSTMLLLGSGLLGLAGYGRRRFKR